LTSVTQRTSLKHLFYGLCCTAQDDFGDTSPVENGVQTSGHQEEVSRFC
jgi:hypothetical protein